MENSNYRVYSNGNISEKLSNRLFLRLALSAIGEIQEPDQTQMGQQLVAAGFMPVRCR
jgi:hypothetical protein